MWCWTQAVQSHFVHLYLMWSPELVYPPLSRGKKEQDAVAAGTTSGPPIFNISLSRNEFYNLLHSATNTYAPAPLLAIPSAPTWYWHYYCWVLQTLWAWRPYPAEVHPTCLPSITHVVRHSNSRNSRNEFFWLEEIATLMLLRYGWLAVDLVNPQ